MAKSKSLPKKKPQANAASQAQPCPFCDHKKLELFHRASGGLDFVYVHCPRCSACGPSVLLKGKTEVCRREAVDLWNHAG